MSRPFSIVFVGTPDFAVPALRLLAQHSAFHIDLVLSQPDRPAGRHTLLQPSPVKTCALDLRLPLWQPDNLSVSLSSLPLAHRPDFLVVVGYGQILSQDVLDFPLIAPVNVHASLLPTWRGASPIQHALLHGDLSSGVTVQKMILALDAGPVLAQERIQLASRDTFLSVYTQLSVIGARLLVDTLLHPLVCVDQDVSQVSYCRKLTRQDGVVDPRTMTAQEIDRHVRALVPWPGVTCYGYKLLATALTLQPHAFSVPCAGGTILFVTRIQPPGKRPMNGDDFARGHSLL